MTRNLDEVYKHLDPIKAQALKLLDKSLALAVKQVEAGNLKDVSLAEVAKLIEVATKSPLAAVAPSVMKENVAKLKLLQKQDNESDSITG